MDSEEQEQKFCYDKTEAIQITGSYFFDIFKSLIEVLNDNDNKPLYTIHELHSPELPHRIGSIYYLTNTNERGKLVMRIRTSHGIHLINLTDGNTWGNGSNKSYQFILIRCMDIHVDNYIQNKDTE